MTFYAADFTRDAASAVSFVIYNSQGQAELSDIVAHFCTTYGYPVDVERVERALTELVNAKVAQCDGESYTFDVALAQTMRDDFHACYANTMGSAASAPWS